MTSHVSSLFNFGKMEWPEPVVFAPVGDHRATFIFLHGFGYTAEELVPHVEKWRSNARFDGVKFILPNARSIPITAVRRLSLVAN